MNPESNSPMENYHSTTNEVSYWYSDLTFKAVLSFHQKVILKSV